MDTFARGNFNVDYEARIDWERLRRERVERTQAHRFVKRDMRHLPHVDIRVDGAIGLHSEESLGDRGTRCRPPFLVLHGVRIDDFDVDALGEPLQERGEWISDRDRGFGPARCGRSVGLPTFDARRKAGATDVARRG